MYNALFCCKILMKAGFSRQIFEKHSIFKFYENGPSGSRVVPWGRMEIVYSETEVTKLTVAFRNFAKANNN
jgi:hypothetical protein